VRLVIALGGNALLQRGEPLEASVQRRNVAAAARALAPVARDHQKDLAAALLATALGAEALLLLTDVDAVYAGWGTPAARAIRRAAPGQLRRMTFAPGSMAPKVEAACRFVAAGGGFAAIGALADVEAVLGGAAGTRIVAGNGGAPDDGGDHG
jgi:carbamate kinase